jgi:hypothetical protein
MNSFRLLSAVVIVSLCTVPLLAQGRSGDATSDNVAMNQFRIRPYPQIDLVSQDSREDDSAAHRGDQDAERASKDIAEREAFKELVESQLPTCYSIRSYVVVRDDPNSDSTHHDSSTTCVPASRFKVYTSDRMPNLKIVGGR